MDRPKVEAVEEGAWCRQRHLEPLLMRDAALAACQQNQDPQVTKTLSLRSIAMRMLL